MILFKTALTACLLAGLCVAKDDPKGRYRLLRRGARPPPYAVQMEPIVQYSQRDPLYNPLVASAKTDDNIYEDPSAYNYYPTEPEPIIEIIIKESNESLPAPPTISPPSRRTTKQPIQVFYVKYEKKKGYGDKPEVVYDPPVPALTPVEDHEEIVPDTTGYGDKDLNNREDQLNQAVTLPPEPSTTLRAIIRPDSEVYHSGSSGIRITFNSEQLPPNIHYKRNDAAYGNASRNATVEKSLSENTISLLPTPLPSPGASKRPHGPYQPQQPLPPRPPQGPPFPQQRIVNSFPHQPNFYQQNLPQHQFQNQQPPPHARPPAQRPPQRHPITIQGLPEVQQRQQFNTYVAPSRGPVNQIAQPLPPQQSNFIPPSAPLGQQNIVHQNIGQSHGQNHGQNHGHQNIQLQNEAQPPFPHRNFNYPQTQQQDKQRYQEQRRPDLLKEQQRLLEQRYYEQRLQEQKRKQEYEQQQQQLQQQQQQQQLQQLQQQQQQQQQYRQQLQKYNPGQFLHHTQQPNQAPPAKSSGEIFKAIPKLEQHIAIRENPLQPGPFPQNPQNVYQSQEPQLQFGAKTHKQFQNVQQQVHKSVNTNGQKPSQPPYQSYYSQNLFGETGRLPQTPFSWSRPAFQPNEKIYATPLTTNDNSYSTTTKPVANYKPYVTTTTTAPTTTTTTTTTPAPTTTTASPQNEAKIRANIANLPAEVPDDIRQQLLSSGILGNADIQVLDYDKIGDTPIESLSPEALANFYGAGGGSVSLASEPIPAVAKKPKEAYPKKVTSDLEAATLRPGGVEMKVIRFDPNTAQGQSVAEKHIREDATRLEPVSVGPKDDSQYNRYLPLKVSGASFPIPDVPELNGKRISSVVVLAPLDYNFQEDETRQARKLGDMQNIRFIAGDSLKQLVKKPTAENYKKWLEQERHTEPQRQSVVLLVTTPKDDEGEKEIFMYDIASKTVSKLSGDLSSAFVDAAESNTDEESIYELN